MISAVTEAGGDPPRNSAASGVTPSLIMRPAGAACAFFHRFVLSATGAAGRCLQLDHNH